MQLTRLRTALWLTLKSLLRRRIVVLLVFIVPTVFTALILLTTGDLPIQFLLASIGDGLFVEVPQQSEGLVFVGIVSVGVLTAFLALDLVQRDAEANRRLFVCGYRPSELIAARLGVLLLVVLAVSVYVAAIVRLFLVPERTVSLALGFAATGWVYGCYGLLVGAAFRRELEGILFVVLLANIDAGWLQNPLYYADAHNQAIIRSLPAYFPAQASMTAAFTTHSTLAPMLASAAYGMALLLVAVAVYAIRVRAPLQGTVWGRNWALRPVRPKSLALLGLRRQEGHLHRASANLHDPHANSHGPHVNSHDPHANSHGPQVN